MNEWESLIGQVSENTIVVFMKKKFNGPDDDDVHLHLVYARFRDAIISGSLPCTYQNNNNNIINNKNE